MKSYEFFLVIILWKYDIKYKNTYNGSIIILKRYLFVNFTNPYIFFIFTYHIFLIKYLVFFYRKITQLFTCNMLWLKLIFLIIKISKFC